jgi:hypothetical protein
LSTSYHHMFADEYHIYLSFSPKEVARAAEGVNTDLRSAELWAERNGLKLNSQKTQMICMGTSRGVRSVKAYVNSSPIQFMGTSLEFQESVRSPGFPPVRIWYGQSEYWKVCPCPVRTKPKTAKCPYISQKTCCPYQLSVFFVSKIIFFCKIYQKNL